MTDIRTQYLIERAIDGNLTPEEQQELQDLKTLYPELESQISAEVNLANLMKGQASASFRPEFHAKVMEQISREAENQPPVFDADFVDRLWNLFPKVGLPSLGTACVFMFANASTAAAEIPIIDALFGLPSEQLQMFSIF
ncbi:MAG: hypothetical protein CME01_10855 [Geminicoccus sp.]|nr:hypothetical protein [Geminicoccus sp.]